MKNSAEQNDGNRDADQRRIPGDPGVGGLLSDPLKPAEPHDDADPSSGPPSPDPAPPRHHGDWTLPRKASNPMLPSTRLASATRRKSCIGMPHALFSENDGSTLDDLRALASRIDRLKPPSGHGFRQEG